MDDHLVFFCPNKRQKWLDVPLITRKSMVGMDFELQSHCALKPTKIQSG